MENTQTVEKASRFTKTTLLPLGNFTKHQYAELNAMQHPAAYASIQKRILNGILKSVDVVKTGKRGKPAILFAKV